MRSGLWWYNPPQITIGGDQSSASYCFSQRLHCIFCRRSLRTIRPILAGCSSSICSWDGPSSAGSSPSSGRSAAIASAWWLCTRRRDSAAVISVLGAGTRRPPVGGSAPTAEARFSNRPAAPAGEGLDVRRNQRRNRRARLNWFRMAVSRIKACFIEPMLLQRVEMVSWPGFLRKNLEANLAWAFVRNPEQTGRPEPFPTSPAIPVDPAGPRRDSGRPPRSTTG